MSFTLNDIALLLIALAIGTIIGLMISGRGKYRRLWRDEQAVHRAAIKDRDARIQASDKRIIELEKQNPAVTPVAPVVTTGLIAERDDLTRIAGISQSQATALDELGYQRYAQIAALDGEQEAALEARLGLRTGTIVREGWREQARSLDSNAKDGQAGRITTPV